MPYTPNGVVAYSFSFPDFTFTMNVSGAVTVADVGRAVTLDPATANTVKLAADGDNVYGRLESLETGGLDGLTVGAVARKFRAAVDTNVAVTVGAEVVGSATIGKVKPTAVQPTEGLKNNRVIQVLSATRAIVEKL